LKTAVDLHFYRLLAPAEDGADGLSCGPAADQDRVSRPRWRVVPASRRRRPTGDCEASLGRRKGAARPFGLGSGPTPRRPRRRCDPAPQPPSIWPRRTPDQVLVTPVRRSARSSSFFVPTPVAQRESVEVAVDAGAWAHMWFMRSAVRASPAPRRRWSTQSVPGGVARSRAVSSRVSSVGAVPLLT
jgi:hypothetical protein